MLMQADLGTRRVQTIAGNGQKGNDYVGGGKGRNQQLNSPWDVAFDAKVCSSIAQTMSRCTSGCPTLCRYV